MTFYDIMRIKMAAMVIQVPMEINFWSLIFQLGMEILTTGTKAIVNVCYSEKIETWQNSFINVLYKT